MHRRGRSAGRSESSWGTPQTGHPAGSATSVSAQTPQKGASPGASHEAQRVGKMRSSAPMAARWSWTARDTANHSARAGPTAVPLRRLKFGVRFPDPGPKTLRARKKNFFLFLFDHGHVGEGG